MNPFSVRPLRREAAAFFSSSTTKTFMRLPPRPQPIRIHCTTEGSYRGIRPRWPCSRQLHEDASQVALIAKEGTEWPIEDSAAPIHDRAGVVRGRRARVSVWFCAV